MSSQSTFNPYEPTRGIQITEFVTTPKGWKKDDGTMKCRSLYQPLPRRRGTDGRDTDDKLYRLQQACYRARFNSPHLNLPGDKWEEAEEAFYEVFDAIGDITSLINALTLGDCTKYGKVYGIPEWFQIATHIGATESAYAIAALWPTPDVHGKDANLLYYLQKFTAVLRSVTHQDVPMQEHLINCLIEALNLFGKFFPFLKGDSDTEFALQYVIEEHKLRKMLHTLAEIAYEMEADKICRYCLSLLSPENRETAILDFPRLAR